MFSLFILTLFSLSLHLRVYADSEVKEDLTPLPRVYDYNETIKCQNEELYCKLNIKLSPIDENNPPEVWKRIEEINKSNRRFYRRDYIYRGSCFERNSLPKTYDEYEQKGLIGSIEYSHCKGEPIPMDKMELFLGITLICYVIFLIYSTKRTCTADKQNKPVNKLIDICSLINIWKDIRKPNQSDDFQRLLCIQGIRTITMIAIVMAHTFMATVMDNLENPEYVETMFTHPLNSVLISSFSYIVHIFFIISAWLLAIQLQNIVRKNGEITLRDVLLLAVNRYFRLIPAVVVVIFLHRTLYYYGLESKPMFDSIVSTEVSRCKTGWWKNMLFIQNLEIFHGQICSPGTWYIAADTQIYILVVILFYLSKKIKVPLKYFLILIGSITICIQGYIVLTSDFDGLLRFSPRLLPPETYFSRPEFVYSYTSTITNIPTYFIGFTFGELYSKNKQKNIFDTFIKKICWFIIVFGLPYLVCCLDFYEYSRTIEAVMAVSLRPIFALGIATGLLGLSTGTGGLLKLFLEWEPLVFLGNVTYSVYMFHFIFVFGRFILLSEKAVFLDDSLYIRNNIIDIVLSFSVGIIMYIVLEHPCIQIQKIIVPQVTMKKEMTRKDK